MAKALSLDLRERVAAVVVGGMSRRKAATNTLCRFHPPTFNANGTLALCITLLNIRGRLVTDYAGQPASLLKQPAERISRCLGGGSRQTRLAFSNSVVPSDPRTD